MLEMSVNTGQTKEELADDGLVWRRHGSLRLACYGRLLALLARLIVWLVVRLLPGSGGATIRPVGESAVEILDRRLASGEIDLQAWQAQRSALLTAQRDRK